MKVLLLGSGGREHALAWKLLQSPRLRTLFVTTKNASPDFLKKEFLQKEIMVVDLSEVDPKAVTAFCETNKIDLIMIGGEAPLVAGVSDALSTAGFKVFAPSKLAAEIETSKAFAKDFMMRHSVPTARYQVFSDFEKAKKYLYEVGQNIVIKASGLAAGKGVFLPETIEEAEKILKELLCEKSLGVAANEILIEEKLTGPEVSLLAFCDGRNFKLMPVARDHKRLQEGNEGPNTGGMGAIAPVMLDEKTLDFCKEKIFKFTLEGLAKEGRPFVGVLYAGLMLTQEGPRVLEFNARFGDPETQALMLLLETDLLEILEACCTKNLDKINIVWKDQHAVCVVLASEGYPISSSSSTRIALDLFSPPSSRIPSPSSRTGNVRDPADRDVKPQNDGNQVYVFHAGTVKQGEEILTKGGRVLSVVATEKNLEAAREKVYHAVDYIHFRGKIFRKDIGL